MEDREILKILKKLEKEFNEDIVFIKSIYEDCSKVFEVSIGGRSFVIKLKNRLNAEGRMHFVDMLYEKVSLPKIIYESDGVVVKEKVEGISLFEYLKNKNNYYFRDKMDEVDIRICSDIGRYMREFHSVPVGDNLMFKDELDTLITFMGEGIKEKLRVDLDKCYKKIKDIKTSVFDLSGPVIIHGDFHNFNNLMVSIEGDFLCVVDYDFLNIGNRGVDLSQILTYIFNNDVGANAFWEGYTLNMNEDELDLLIKDINYGYCLELIQEVINVIKGGLHVVDPEYVEKISKDINDFVQAKDMTDIKPLRYINIR